jgi:phosphonate transport system permease protein
MVPGTHTVRSATAAYPDVFRFWTPRRAGLLALTGAALALLVFGLWHNGVAWPAFAAGLGKLGRLPSLMFPPSLGAYPLWSPEQGPHVFVRALGETIAMAFLGTLTAAVCAFPVALLAARNIMPSGIVRFFARRTSDAIRSIDALIWAIVFIKVVGLGPFAGVLAIAVGDFGAFIKLFSETLEATDRKPAEGVLASGGSPLHVVRFGYLPTAAPVLLSQILYYFESNTRSSTIIGIVGAGGIGLLLQNRMSEQEWGQVAAIVLMILATVAAIDWLSGKARRAAIGKRTG